MTAPYVYTYSDVLEVLDRFARYGGPSADQTLRRMCVQAAYREITAASDWSFLHTNGRIPVYAPDEFTDVAFDLTGGTYDRQLTSSGSGETWPSWAEDACVRLGDPAIICDIDQKKSDTVVTLDATMCPTADVTSTTATLFPRWYRLPNDFVSMARPMDEDSWCLGMETSKETIEQLIRYETTTGNIERFAVGAPQDLFGAMALYLWPPTDEDETLDVPYRRRPRQMRYSGHEDAEYAGTITISAGAAAVVGSGTSFSSSMVGSIFRIGDSATYAPTGLEGQYPYVEQRSIIAVADAENLTLDANVVNAASAKQYRITDAVDLDIGIYDAFLACAKKHLAKALRGKDTREVEADYLVALRRAKETDCRTHHPQVAGVPRRHVVRLIDSTSRDQE